MFRNSNLKRYFLRVGVSKSRASGASSSIGNAAYSGFGDGGCVIPIATEVANPTVIVPIVATPVIDLRSSLQESITHCREYLATDPCYIHPSQEPPKCSCETLHSVYNQLRKKRRSNPAVKINSIELLRLLESIEVVDLSQEKVTTIEISSDQSDFFDVNVEQAETDKDVLVWITTNEDPSDKKRNYEATCRF